MKTLFIMILTLVFLIGNLVSPESFSYSGTVQNEPTVIPTQTAAGTNTNEEEADVITVVRPVNTMPSSANNTINNPDQNVGTANGNDPESLFGSAKSEDTFERGSSGFGLSAGLNDDENIRIIALNNRLSLEPKKSNGWISWRLRPPTIKDGAAEMKFSIITCARGDRTGVMMRAADYNSGHGYYFSLACEGTISILKDSTVLGTADARGAFKNNSGDVNIMTALVQGNTLTAILNGENILTVQDDSYAEGFSGFFTAPQVMKSLTMDILSFKEYYNENVQ